MQYIYMYKHIYVTWQSVLSEMTDTSLCYYNVINLKYFK